MSFFRKKRVRLFHVSSRPLRERAVEHRRGESTLEIYHSRFNDRWLTELGIEPRVILDVGSYDGGDAVRFRQAFPRSRIIAIEADPARFALVEGNVEGLLIETLNFAVLDRDGPAEWYAAVDDRIGSIGAQGSIYRQSEEQDAAFPFVHQSRSARFVEGRRLDTLCDQFAIGEIDLLHVDIQGAEHAALVGLGSRRPKAIFLEWQAERIGWIGSAQAEATEALLAASGYHLAADVRSDRLYVRTEFAKFRGVLGAFRRRWVALRRGDMPPKRSKLRGIAL